MRGLVITYVRDGKTVSSYCNDENVCKKSEPPRAIEIESNTGRLKQ